ncbi:uncharacterized protein [Narcine bancroftii]|uniref:uncharacterized protein isoform X2 n=1 Tax=Narcine bancroftii TaxID=1343680 RepID=UPI0038319E5D
MEEHRNPIIKSRKFKWDSRRTARRRRGLPESLDPQVEEVKQEEQWSSGEKFIMEKVHEFFQECGGGDRGFITREDMQKLQQKFPFSSEELEVVFDKLDVDTKGILTPEQLTKGLSHFLSNQTEVETSDDPKVPPESLYQSHDLQHQVEVEDEEKQQFTTLMQRLGAGAIFGDKSEIWKLWIQLRRNEPNLLGHLEDLLCKVTGHIQETLQEKEELEHTLRKKMAEHNADVRRLYEEMELQINNEKERIESESVVRFQAQSQDLQKELDSKQDEVQHLVQMQTQLQAELVSLRGNQEESNIENQELKLTNQETASQLKQMQQALQEARDRLQKLEEEAAHREEKEGEWDQSLGREGPCTEAAVQQLQAELMSLRSEQEKTCTENQELKLTNQDLETRLEGIQRELQEAQDRLEWKKEEWNQAPDPERLCSEEANQQDTGQKCGSDITQRNRRSEDLQSTQRKWGHANRIISIEEEPLPPQDSGMQGSEVTGQEAGTRPVKDGDGVFDEVEGPPQGEDATDPIKELQAELVSLRSVQEETSTENQGLKLANQELETRLEGIQLELQEARDQLEILQGEKRGQDQPSGSGSTISNEAVQQLQAELTSLRTEQEETSTVNKELKMTNQELETRLEGIQQELQEARDQLKILQEAAAHHEEKERERSRSLDIEQALADEAAQKAELVSLRSKQEEMSTENKGLKLTNQELETKLEGIQWELQEARGRLEILQEEAAQKEEKEGAQSRLLDIKRAQADEVAQQLQAELMSLRSEQEETNTENQKLKLTNQALETRLEEIQWELQEAWDQLKILQEEAAEQEEKEGERNQSLVIERALADEAAQQLQVELMSLRSEQEETITKNQGLKLTNQKLEMRLEGIQRELQEARDQLQILHEEGQQSRSLGIERALADEAAQQLQAELTSLHSEQQETSTMNQEVKLTNQELTTQLKQSQLELQKARDWLEILQEQSAHREEKGVWDRSPRGEEVLCPEAIQQLQEELVSLRSEQEETSIKNQELKLINQGLETRLEGIQRELQEARDQLEILQEEAAHRKEKEGLQRTRSIRRHGPPQVSRKLDPLGEVKGQEVTLGREGDEAHQETEATPARDGGAVRIAELQAELVSLRGEQEETSTENKGLKLTNQELEIRLEGIQRELQETRDTLKIFQDEAAHREEKEGLQRAGFICSHAAPHTLSKPDAMGELEGQEVTLGRDGAHEETAAERIKKLQKELVSLHSIQQETSTENQTLKLTNQALETRLEEIQRELQEAQDQLKILQEEVAQQKEKEGLQRTRSIRHRAPPLLSRNPGEVPHLRVESQEVILRAGEDGDPQESAAASTMDGAEEKITELQAELISLHSKQEETSAENQELKLANQELKMHLERIQQELQEAQDQLVILQEEREGLHRTRSIRRRTTRHLSSHPSTLGVQPQLRVEDQEVTLGRDAAGARADTPARDGAAGKMIEVDSSKDPDQVYNIMFVGNTNAGKTSFIQHFCDGNFQLELPSTIGIDYRVKTLMVENRYIALQVWDTAGQERFHSLTKQFFRKADGVVVMYDVGSLSSFKEVRYWMSCIKEAVSEEVCILLLGNKIDVSAHRQVHTVQGEQLAQEYNILFYECSACTGHNIIAPMIHLLKLLRQQGEKLQGKTVELVKKPTKKQKCCT